MIPKALLPYLPPSLARRGLPPVRRAETAAERLAIYRFRYRVYHDELGRRTGGVDHDARLIRNADDELDTAHHFYVGAVEDVLGVVRVRVWRPGEVPARELEVHDLPRLGPALERLTVGEVGRFMIRADQRGGLALPALGYATYPFLARDHRIDISVMTCRPPLVPYYRQLGAREFGANLYDGPDGIEVPMLAVPSDLDYLRRVGSPLAPLVGTVFGPKGRPPVDDSAFRHLFDDQRARAAAEPARSWLTLDAELSAQADRDRATFLDRLPRPVRDAMLRDCVVVEVPAGSVVIREGAHERELYVVLAGACEASHAGAPITRFGRGDVFGEMAFFRDGGERAATVTALRSSRVAVIRRGFLAKLDQEAPGAEREVLLHLGRVLAERLAAMTP